MQESQPFSYELMNELTKKPKNAKSSTSTGIDKSLWSHLVASGKILHESH